MVFSSNMTIVQIKYNLIYIQYLYIKLYLVIDVFNQQCSNFANINHVMNVVHYIIRQLLCKHTYLVDANFQ
jgi:hypothetical protein